eukprot:CAMPEP_0172724128 /NCGR_PEP_ID=MMETSP1074-20121228/85204_1 /TAXON_ID=2916 /ORGANISM="Ceratium fusus, Strain PA161109" /LENGTH=171 /DNA_ID=CAMNT_0013550497 /DNA_START=15 /DNA_END=530 /DNA_ORIENTATION=-
MSRGVPAVAVGVLAGAAAGAALATVVVLQRTRRPKVCGGKSRTATTIPPAATTSGTSSAVHPDARSGVVTPGVSGVVEIEYCNGCRWLLRAAWLAQEILTTFAAPGEASMLHSVTLIPNVEKPGGVFRVRMDGQELWDRKTQGGFPEAKVLKQLVRDQIAPQRDLGHSDTK